ncbi:MAG: diguanylate cyclase [Polyangiales bacterium]|jgi:diguanylate cyclase (GGDEF)-like protein
MTALVQAALRVRRTARSSWGLGGAIVLAAFLLAGFFVPASRPLGWGHALWLGAWLGLFGSRARNTRQHGTDPRSAFELGVILLVGVFALIQLRGGVGSHLYPLAYVAVALVASFSFGWSAIGIIAFAVVLGFGVAFFGENVVDPTILALNAFFTASFGALSRLFTRAEIVRVRRSSKRELAAQREKARDDMRLFRLVAPSSDGVRDEERLYQTSVQEVRQALYHALQLLHKTLDLHTCVLLMPGDEGEQLRIAELITQSDDIAEGPFSLGAGVVGAAVRRQVTTSLHPIRPGYRGICYYRGPAAVSSVIAVPVLERGHLRAVLCADRAVDRQFSPQEEELLRESTPHILRAFENERVFMALETSKREQEILYRASQAFSTALTQDAVMEAGLAAATEIAPHDFAAITEYQAEGRRHVVKRAVGEQGLNLQGLRFRDNTSLTAMVVKNRHYLPYRGDFDSKQQVLFTKKAKLKGMESLLVLPLVVREEPIGTLIIAAKAHKAFSSSVRETLQALGNQLAVSLANARAVRQLEELATTDGLTGCLNKRAFLAELSQKLMAAQRFGRKLSLIIADLDHFKGVNDTYGHATGDRVLRELGQVLKRMKRETDLVARFGGEEFCVLCEETDARGAKLLAERVREELAATELQTELGTLRITASLGVATFPDHAKSAEDLFSQGDKALYQAKNQGRNRVCTV